MKRSLLPWSQQHKLMLWLTAAVVATGMTLPERSSISVAVNAQTPPPPASYRDRFITTKEGRRIHYLDWGSAGKRPFIMLHGINRSAHTFDHIAPLLHRDFHVIAMDLRGFGDSDWSPKGEYLVEDFVRDLHDLVQQLNLRDIVLTGNSMGGRVVQVYAGLHPDRTGKVIVEDVGPERPESVTTTLTQRIQRERPRGGLLKKSY
jgi:pimeloyl-ACP methyl ester carboxylesterase